MFWSLPKIKEHNFNLLCMYNCYGISQKILYQRDLRSEREWFKLANRPSIQLLSYPKEMSNPPVDESLINLAPSLCP